tara:strand:+ start:315 stop:578 length:264 start_codon:yes stop_codon:yes gene_type:complete
MIKVRYYADKNEISEEYVFSDISDLNKHIQINTYIKTLLKEGYEHQFHEYTYAYDNGDDALFFRSLMITTNTQSDELFNRYIKILRH